jgi:hypothetical protein
MRRAAVIALTGLTMIALSARPAWAQWEWFKWIQELSGPGPFELHGATFTFGCRDDAESVSTEDTSPLAYRGLFCDRVPHRWKSVDRFLAVTVAHGDGRNNLVYPSSVEPRERVTAWMIRLAATKRVHRTFDVGSGVGFLRFSAVQDAFVTKYYLDPYVALRPLGFLAPRSGNASGPRDFLARSIDLTAGAIIFPQGFRLSDFGAIGGAELNGDAELSWHAGLRVVVIF